MKFLEERHKRIIKKVNLDKLPFKIREVKFRTFVTETTRAFSSILKSRESNEALKWCFSTVKKGKVFIKIFESNYEGTKMYKEELSKSLPEYSYKTIANIVDEGMEKGYFVELRPRTQTINDAKIKNLRPSEDVASAFINWYIEAINSFNSLIKNNK
jgi:hypothetical protein|tara:strand:+ start:183 stop:653 length:471 start_codon:yes stop_codon:yes gene_type:complete